MIRSVLVSTPIVPGMMAKSVKTAADGVMIELEDGVHRTRKEEARNAVIDFVRAGDFNSKHVMVRVNAVRSDVGQEDIRALGAIGAPVLLLPKVRSAADIEIVHETLKRAETDSSLPIGTTRLWVMVETTEAVLGLEAIADSPRVEGFVMGSADLSAELRVRKIGVGANRPIWDFPLELLYAKERVVMVARSRGLIAHDTGFGTIRDLEGTRHAALISSQMGFDGTGAFSPKQVPIVNDVFTPSRDEYEWARRAVAALHEADERGQTVVIMDDEMVEGPLLRNAGTIVRRYEIYEKRDRARAEEATQRR